MKTRLSILGLVVALVAFYGIARAEDAKQVTLQGNMQCGKCALHQTDKCSNVLVVKEGDKDVQYDIVAGEGFKVQHVCQGTKAVKVTGTVNEKDGKKMINATKIEDANG
jgi:hypothetical protein